MEKSFRSLARDPWNKLKVYFCLRMIESDEEPAARARLLVELADARKRMDPVLALALCEAALKLVPQDPQVLSRVRALLVVLAPPASNPADRGFRLQDVVPESTMGRRVQRDAARPAGHDEEERRRLEEEERRRREEEERRRREEEERRRREEEERRRREEEERRRREEEERRRREEEERRRREEEERRRREEEERRRREEEALLRAEIRSAGYGAYMRKLLAAHTSDAGVMTTLNGFQPTPMGMVQFLEFVRFKKMVSESVWRDIVKSLGQAVALADPEDPALEALRDLVSS